MKKSGYRFAAIFLAGVLLLSSGCAARGKADRPAAAPADPFAVTVSLTNRKEDHILIQTAIPVFSGFQAADALNEKIKKVSEDGLAQLRQDTKDIAETPGAGSLYYGSYFDYTRSGELLSVWITSEDYSGGAHGMRWMHPFTVNTRTGESYASLSSLFRDPDTELKKVTDRILEQIQKQPDNYFPDAAKTVGEKNGNYSFYLDGSNLVVFFDLYEILPYAGGFATFSFPLSDFNLLPSLGTDSKPLGNARLNGATYAMKNAPFTDENGSYLPLEETAAVLGHPVVVKDGVYTVDGKVAKTRRVEGKIYTPITFFSETLGDFAFYDGTALRLFTQTAAVVKQTTAAPTGGLAFIRGFDAAQGTLTLDPIEWLTPNDAKRIQELKLNPDTDFPNGFYIYNPSVETVHAALSSGAEFYLIRWNSGVPGEAKAVDRETFFRRLGEKDALSYPYRLTGQSGEINRLEEQYLP